MSEMAITRDDWLRAVGEAAIEPDMDDPAVLTLQEFGNLIGMARSAALPRMNRLLEAGKATRTRKRIRRSDGAIMSVPAFRLVQPEG